jgi:UDP-2,3-diacylglucosamine pyrophosphatase LpxH
VSGNEVKAFIVISDTHLGLRAGRRLHFFQNTVTGRPIYVDQFLDWLLKLENDGAAKVKIGDRPGHFREKELVPPAELILNGDIFELWDASDSEVEIASYSILQRLSRLKAKKVYLVGNHDIASEKLSRVTLKSGRIDSGEYPWGTSSLEVFGDTYPAEGSGTLPAIKVGGEHYLFLHGHQFDPIFRFNIFQITAALRDGAEGLRLYSWAVFWSWVFSILLTIVANSVGSYPLNWIGGLAVAILGILAVPRLFVSIGRPIWNGTIGRIHGMRYSGKPISDRFRSWWNRFAERDRAPERLHVVYGHTHEIGVTTVPFSGRKFVLVNHPAWVKDLEKYQHVIQAVFVYADAEGFEFFGWDWVGRRPFHIPKVVTRHDKEGVINEQIAQWLSDIGWPDKLVEEWRMSAGIKRR